MIWKIKHFLRIKWQLLVVNYVERKYGLLENSKRSTRLVVKANLQRVLKRDIPDSVLESVFNLLFTRYVFLERPVDPYAIGKRRKKLEKYLSEGIPEEKFFIDEIQNAMPDVEESNK